MLHIELRGADVAIVEGFDEVTSNALAKAAMESRKQEVKPAK